MEATTLTCDVLILGGGGAGLFAALHAWQRQPRLHIVVAAKGIVGQSGCTRMVQGGFNAVLDPADSLEAHFLDTLQGGAWLNDQELAWVMVQEAPQRIAELESLGCFFDRRPDGRIAQKPFAGQSFHRTVHRGDLTGIEVMTRLKERLLGTPVTFLDDHRALDLLPAPDGGCAGALLLNTRTGRFLVALARMTIVATGGGARMYRIAAPSLEKSGDGMAMLWRAGVVLRDMEMFQFHPTGLVAGPSVLTGAVLEEGLRGAGGRLYNARGERFMARYDPQRLERSTRDVVARACYLEILEGRGTPEGAVLLDVSHLGAEFVERAFPGMVRRCREAGYDLAREPVPVSPTAHFHMGGARIDPWCRTSLPGLLVAGEDAGGVHGANRLGGNGIAESTVFGGRAGQCAAEEALSRPPPATSPAALQEAITRALAPFSCHGSHSPFAVRRALQDLLWEKGGLVRTARGLQEALEGLDALAERLRHAPVPHHREVNLAWQAWLDTANMLTVARLLVESALLRTESRGSHYRADFPEPNDREWLRTICVQRMEGDASRLWTEPVPFTRVTPPGMTPGGGHPGTSAPSPC